MEELRNIIKNITDLSEAEADCHKIDLINSAILIYPELIKLEKKSVFGEISLISTNDTTKEKKAELFKNCFLVQNYISPSKKLYGVLYSSLTGNGIITIKETHKLLKQCQRKCPNGSLIWLNNVIVFILLYEHQFQVLL